MDPGMSIGAHDLEALRYAKGLLENPSLAARIAGAVGVPIEAGIGLLPANVRSVVNKATEKALQTAMSLALATLTDNGTSTSADRLHKLAVAATGAGGGLFGLGGLSVELPISTTVMLRSVADVARSEGERVKSPETKIACMQVFALGGAGGGDDAAESGYFAVRTALARAAGDASRYLARQGASASAPPLVRFVTAVAQRFGIVVSEKVAAQAIPLVGAVGGAAINVLFMDHFQNMARGHFTVRRVERAYGAEVVRQVYAEL
jgi:hypothetical protein